MSNCIFCKIGAGEIPSEKIGENERAFAFLDINPLARGHALVIPKRHAERVADLPADDAAALMLLAQDIARRATRGLGVGGATIAINDGRAAGQEVPHVHVHIVPRTEGDGFGPIHALFQKRPTVSKDELKDIGRKLRG